ncbi:hypothetical protein HQ520_02440 [bacterium]|nr:hypothetical protein [bacterium]
MTDEKDRGLPPEKRQPEPEPTPPPPEAQDSDDFVHSLSEEIVDSFIGDDVLEEERVQQRGLWHRFGRIGLRLLLPRANQWGFAIGFWVLRVVGAIIVASWLYFGLRFHIWDGSKFMAGLSVLFLGPLIFRAIEFLLENLVLRGASRASWRDFWNFKRMMTPRSIQSAFFVGFWLLVIWGMAIVFGGFRDLVSREHVGSFQEAATSFFQNFEDAESLVRNLLESDEPVAKYLRSRLAPGTLQELSDYRIQETAGQAEWSLIRDELPTDTLKSINRYVESGSIPSQVWHRWQDELPSATLVQIERILAEAPPESIWTRLLDELRPAEKVNSFARILKGILVMVVGPFLLRLTAESIILFFRINETLTDVLKELETANRRAEGEKEDETHGAT